MTLGTRRYAAADVDRVGAYERVRLRILFEKWCPETTDIVFAAVMCSTCGFVSHLPRAESGDLAAKYRTLLEWGLDYGSGETDDVARARSKELFAAIGAAFEADSSLRVLDYGGGDGRLMHAFRAVGRHRRRIDRRQSLRHRVLRRSRSLGGRVTSGRWCSTQPWPRAGARRVRPVSRCR